MSVGRHSFVAFYPSDWMAGTSRLTRLVKSVYHDICLYNWDKNRPAPKGEIVLMVSDLPNGEAIVDALIEAGTLKRNADGSVYSERAIAEADKAFQLWTAKSAGGKNRRKTHPAQMEESSSTHRIEPEPSPEPEPSLESPTGDKEAIGLKEIADAWNEMARSSGLSQIARMTDERRSRLTARIEEHGAETILTAIGTVPDSPFLMGENDRGWKADFGFFLSPKNCIKLIEGGYHNRKRGGGSGWTSN